MQWDLCAAWRGFFPVSWPEPLHPGWTTRRVGPHGTSPLRRTQHILDPGEGAAAFGKPSVGTASVTTCRISDPQRGPKSLGPLKVPILCAWPTLLVGGEPLVQTVDPGLNLLMTVADLPDLCGRCTVPLEVYLRDTLRPYLNVVSHDQLACQRGLSSIW